MDNLGIFPLPVNALVGIDKVHSFVGFQTFRIEVIVMEFKSLHEVLMSSLRSDGKTTSLVIVCDLFDGIEDR